MSQPVKLSENLILDARLVAEVSDRSIARQIEHWAQLGRAIEGLLRVNEAIALRRVGALRPLSKSVQSVNTPAGHKRLKEYLKTLPYPHYEAADTPGLLVRIDSDGKRTLGRFVNRKFTTVKTKRT